ncbi:MAG: MoaD/ThiS family protein [Planctomycetota bacterium]|nr:MoaD/ThiS family protein [Planctomycetota bacterium]MDA1214407.1 MoaD/ThiS family protein [Planctomycetota bacterium]
MPRVFIPALLKPHTGGREIIDLPGENVRQLIDQLESQFPGIREKLCSDSDMKPGLNVAVDGNISSRGLRQKVAPNSEVHFLSAIGGG